MLLLSFVTRWPSISNVFGDARKYAWNPIIKAVRAPLIPARPGPTLKGMRTVRTGLPFEGWLMLLLLLLLLMPLLGLLFEPSESQP